jgi:predicted nucleic acid-binding Zn ribbon protein
VHSISRLAQSALARPLRAAPLSPGKVSFAWVAVVGPAVARATTVRLEGVTLFVDAASREWQREITRSSSAILPRLQALLGRDAVRTIKARHA